VVEAHGDLRPEHVFLGSAANVPCVIDCLEFDSRLRRLDPAEELAFLALECRRLGGSRVAGEILRGVHGALRDPVPDSVLFFYMSLRAATRAKVTAWHLRDRKLPPRARHWKSKAHSYLRDALHFARLALSRGAYVARAQHVDEPRRIANSALIAHERR
jgi:aminoglycoside phosphotransferase family enzyme